MKNLVSFSLAVSIIAICWLTIDGQSRAKEADKPSHAELRKLYQQAMALASGKEYAKSNETYEILLRALPGKQQYDPNRKQILYSMAGNYARLGEKESSLEFLERAVDAGFWNAEFIRYDANFEALREDTEYLRIVEEARVALLDMIFSLDDIYGNPLKKEDFAGKVLLLDFWGTWCPPCRKELPALVQLQKKYGKNGLQIIGLTCERLPPGEGITDKVVSKVRSFAESQQLNYPLVMLTPQAQLAAGVRSLPTKILVDRKMNVRTRESGGRDYSYLESKALPLLQESPNL